MEKEGIKWITFGVLIGIVFTIICCNCTVTTGEKGQKEVEAYEAIGPYKVIEINGCEYIVSHKDSNSGSRGYGFLAHKGNCKYCMKRLEEKLREQQTITNNTNDYDL